MRSSATGANPMRSSAMRLLYALLSLSALAAAPSAQQPNHVSYPQDTTQNNSGNLVPFGVWPGGNYGDGHSQILIPAAWLPGPGAVIVGLEVQCQNQAALNYLVLNIRVSPTNAASLGTSFAGNLTSPQTVLSAMNLAVTYNGQWTPIAFQVPYTHDGVSSLVLDIEKAVDPATTPLATMSTTSNPGRPDLPPMIYDFGPVGSGAWQSASARVAALPIALRLDVAGAPTMYLRSDRSGPNNNQFALGGSIDHVVMGAPGGLYLDLMGRGGFAPSSLPPVIGVRYVQGILLGLGVLPPGGSATTTIGIPNNPLLAGATPAAPGVHVSFQSIVVDSTGIPMFTNAADCYLYQ